MPERGTAAVEVYLTEGQARKLEKQGVDLTEHTLPARAEKRVADAAEGVFRPYSGKGGLKEEMLRTAQENPSSPRSSPSERRSRARTSWP